MKTFWVLFFLINSLIFQGQTQATAEENTYTIFGVYDKTFLLNGYEFYYQKDKLQIPLISGEQYLIANDEFEQLPEGSYRRKVDLISLKNGVTQTFVSTIMNDNLKNPVTISKVDLLKSEIRSYEKKGFTDRYYTHWVYSIAYNIFLKDGRKYYLTFAGGDTFKKEDTEKELSKALNFLKEGTKVVITRHDPGFYVNSPGTSITFRGQGDRLNIDSLTSTETPVVRIKGCQNSTKRFTLQDYLFNITFQFLNFDFLKDRFPNYVNAYPAETLPAYITVELKMANGIEQWHFHWMDLFDNHHFQYLRNYIDDSGRRIFVFYAIEMKRGVELVGNF